MLGINILVCVAKGSCFGNKVGGQNKYAIPKKFCNNMLIAKHYLKQMLNLMIHLFPSLFVFVLNSLLQAALSLLVLLEIEELYIQIVPLKDYILNDSNCQAASRLILSG